LGNFSRAGGPRIEALNNAKIIAGALTAFSTDYGSYPCAYTRRQLEEKDSINLPPGTNANAYFAQLIATEIIDSETYFYAPNIEGTVRGNNLINSPENLLAKGENGFAYIMTQNEEALSDVKSITPLVIAPIIQGEENPIFDPIPYQDYYVYGAVDGSGTLGKISPTGQALSKGRSHLLESGTVNSLFGTEIPVIKSPLGLSTTPPPQSFSNWHHFAILLLLIALFYVLHSSSKKPPTPES